MKDVIVIAGPTASGKTSLGVQLAKITDGEIISCDSMQIYKDIPICSAAPTREEMEGIPHHLIGFLNYDERFTAQDYTVLAKEKIRDILSRNKQPIIVGGTGMYFHFLIYQADFMPEDKDNIRKNLENLETDEAFRRLLKLNENTRISQNDRKRILRALEVYELTGKIPVDNFDEKKKDTEFNYKLFAISPDREKLYEKINIRVDQMATNGMLKEVETLLNKGVNEENQIYKAIGVRQFKEYFEGKISLDEAIENVKKDSRHYAKRQLTWLRKEDAIWLYKGQKENLQTILETVN